MSDTTFVSFFCSKRLKTSFKMRPDGASSLLTLFAQRRAWQQLVQSAVVPTHKHERVFYVGNAVRAKMGVFSSWKAWSSGRALSLWFEQPRLCRQGLSHRRASASCYKSRRVPPPQDRSEDWCMLNFSCKASRLAFVSDFLVALRTPRVCFVSSYRFRQVIL